MLSDMITYMAKQAAKLPASEKPVPHLTLADILARLPNPTAGHTIEQKVKRIYRLSQPPTVANMVEERRVPTVFDPAAPQP